MRRSGECGLPRLLVAGLSATAVVCAALALTAPSAVAKGLAPPPLVRIYEPVAVNAGLIGDNFVTVEGGTYALGEYVATSFYCMAYPSPQLRLNYCRDNNGGGATWNDFTGYPKDYNGTGHLNTSTPGQHTYYVEARDSGYTKASIRYTVTDTNTSQTGKLELRKQLFPSTDPGRFDLTIDGNVEKVDAGDDDTTGEKTVDTGSHTVAETAGTDTNLSNYLKSISCKDQDGHGTEIAKTNGDSGGPLSVTIADGADVVCTITNVAKGQASVYKTTNGAIDPTQNWTFTLKGTGVDANGTTDGKSDGKLGFSDGLVPGADYTLCETSVPAGWTSNWKLDGQVVAPFNPNATDDPPQDLGNRCYTFQVNAGQTVRFDIDNSRPSGAPLAGGYWKNWNSCTGGGQADMAQKNGGGATGFYILEDLLPQTVGDFTVDTCSNAVNLLSKQDQSGTKRANDAAYELGAQLLAARLNVAAGARSCDAVQTATLAAQNLLVKISFTGSGAYLDSKSKSPDRANARALAEQLNDYNNGSLC